MSISTTTTWKVYQTIIDNEHIYHVSLFDMEGRPVRCLTSMYDNVPIAVIIHIIGHGDWIYFDTALKYLPTTTLPRILNHWRFYKADTEEETNYVKKILYTAFIQASALMQRINEEHTCVCGNPNHGASRCQNTKYTEM